MLAGEANYTAQLTGFGELYSNVKEVFKPFLPEQ
jgi:hypothetical protein